MKSFFLSVSAAIICLMPIIGQAQSDSDFVELESGKVLHGRVALSTPFYGGWQVRLNDSTQVNALDVRAIHDTDGEFVRIDGRSRFARVIQQGHINIFAKLPSDAFLAEPPGTFPLEPICYFSKNGSLAKIVNYDNLRAELADNPQSLSTLNSYRTWQYIKLGAVAVSCAAFLTNFAESNQGKPATVSSLISGVAFAGLALVAHFNQNQELRQAITEYNR